jgi:transposase
MEYKVISVYCSTCKCVVTATPVIDKNNNVTYYCSACGKELD